MVISLPQHTESPPGVLGKARGPCLDCLGGGEEGHGRLLSSADPTTSDWQILKRRKPCFVFLCLCYSESRSGLCCGILLSVNHLDIAPLEGRLCFMSSVQTFIAISSFYISPGGTFFIKTRPADRSI